MPKFTRCIKCGCVFSAPETFPASCPDCGKVYQSVRPAAPPGGKTGGDVASQNEYRLQAPPASSNPENPADDAALTEYRVQSTPAPGVPQFAAFDDQPSKPPKPAKRTAAKRKDEQGSIWLKDDGNDADDSADDEDRVRDRPARAGSQSVPAWIWAIAGGGIVAIFVLLLFFFVLFSLPRAPAPELGNKGVPPPPANAPVNAPVNASVPHPEPVLTGEQLYRRTSPSVMLIVVRNQQGEAVSLGSGFRIDNDVVRKRDPKAAYRDPLVCYLLTNHHVVEGGAKWEARGSNGMVGDIFDTATSDKGLDLALVCVRMRASQLPPALDISRVAPAIGAKVWAIGSPKGLQNSLSEGIVSGIREIRPGVSWLQTTASISPGSSGGPLLLPNGAVVGVSSAQLRGEGVQNLNFAVAAPTIWQFLDRPFGHQ